MFYSNQTVYVIQCTVRILNLHQHINIVNSFPFELRTYLISKKKLFYIMSTKLFSALNQRYSEILKDD